MAAEQADLNQGRVVQNSDGVLYILKDGKKYQIQLADLSDEAIASTPDGSPVQQLDQLFAAAAPVYAFTTRNRLRTEQQLKDELSSAGYGGPWDVSSMLVSYGQVGSAPAAAPTPAAPAAPSFIAVSDAWIEGGVRLIANQVGPSNNYCCPIYAKSNLRVENRSGSTLNFEVDKSVFSIKLSTGKEYRASNVDGLRALRPTLRV